MADKTSFFSEGTLRDRLLGYLRAYIAPESNSPLADEDLLCIAMWAVTVYDTDAWRKTRASACMNALKPDRSYADIDQGIHSMISSRGQQLLRDMLVHICVYLESVTSVDKSELRVLLDETCIPFADTWDRNKLSWMCAAVAQLISHWNPDMDLQATYLLLAREVIGTPVEYSDTNLSLIAINYLRQTRLLNLFWNNLGLYKQQFLKVEEYVRGKLLG